MNYTVIYFIGYILAYLSYKFFVREKDEHSWNDIIFTFFISIFSYSLVISVLCANIIYYFKKANFSKKGPKWL